MRKITLENGAVITAFIFLQELKLKPKASRGRTQFLKRLEEKNKDYIESLNEIRKNYFKTDDDGELIVVDDQITLKEDLEEKEEKEYTEEAKALEEEEAEILFGEHSTKYDYLFKGLEEIDIELSGDDAYIYDILMTAYEANEKED